ncbi:MAG TPA: PIN domain-containing protein [Blastocatellia bacterium]|nr:PIN domain-containing protein [Blastocatellia bacterium]
MIYVLDTHPIVWFLEGSPLLSNTAKTAMSEVTAELVIPTIALVEISFLYAKKRITIDVSIVRQKLLAAGNCSIYPLDEQVASLTPLSLNIHDAIIVATGLVYRDVLKRSVALVTKDGEITRSGLISTIW